MIKRIIPSTGEEIPVIGMGTWQTFDVCNEDHYPVLKSILQQLHFSGGRLIDSSPMYGNSEKVVGDITSGMEMADDFFYATKVWTTGCQQGIDQMESSMKKMKRTKIDLMQIHNLVDLKTQLATLRQWKESGKIKYIGITHYTDDMHEALENIMRKEPIDFVQFNYSIQATHAEKRLLPAAAGLGVATLINRPFGIGKLFNLVQGKPLPAWVDEINIKTWAAYFLKYILANPAVTCVIPATGDVKHAADNFEAGAGILPGVEMRKRMLDYFRSL
jgi:diketogulonate reductase-like aldo/keto reductase